MRFGVYSPSSPAFTLKTRHVALGVTRCVFEGCVWFNTLRPSSAVQGGGPVSSSSERENGFCSKQAVTPGPPRPSGPYNLISSPRLQVTRSDAKRQRSTESWVTQGWLGQERPNRQPGDPPKLLSSAPRVLSLSPPGPPINPPLRPRAPPGAPGPQGRLFWVGEGCGEQETDALLTLSPTFTSQTQSGELTRDRLQGRQCRPSGMSPFSQATRDPSTSPGQQ